MCESVCVSSLVFFSFSLPTPPLFLSFRVSTHFQETKRGTENTGLKQHSTQSRSLERPISRLLSLSLSLLIARWQQQQRQREEGEKSFSSSWATRFRPMENHHRCTKSRQCGRRHRHANRPQQQQQQQQPTVIQSLQPLLPELPPNDNDRDGQQQQLRRLQGHLGDAQGVITEVRDLHKRQYHHHHHHNNQDNHQ